jgi:hypothetical protein
MSGQLLWSKDGADCNLLASPENVKLGCVSVLVEVVVDVVDDVVPDVS